jgi:membrane carboxypeptidase/penicillin-binding protein
MALISIELSSRHITALVGGRGYSQTQFNRIMDGYRQVGSTMKPFVYWAAMDKFDPLSQREDEPYTYKSGNLTWEPKNYDGKYRGAIPLFVGLAESLNVPAAKTGIEIGIDKVVNILKAAGLEKNIQANPSLALGAIELSPWELSQAYSTLGNFGAHQQIHSLERVETLEGETLWDESALPVSQRADAVAAAEVIGMMKATVKIGTAQALKNYKIPQVVAAKTGTTNDLKDAWFVGFTPQQLTVIWVGFDDNRPVGTGAVMALPVWGHFHERISTSLPAGDFTWPEGTTVKSVNLTQLSTQYPYLNHLLEKTTNLDLVFKR